LETRVVDVTAAQSILIQVDYGEVAILESEDSHVSVQGQVLFADELEYQVDSTEKQIKIQAFAQRDSSFKVPLHLVIRLPQQMQVKVETQDAAVLVHGYQGDVEVASTSGDITLEQVTGEMTLRSNRGNIRVQESSGVVSVVGNYGGLTARNVHGDISASTIMGSVVFDGLIGMGDTVRLETDHGAVSVNLSADSDLTLRVSSTSGDVTCLLPDMIFSTRTCNGAMHSGEGSLSIRTVSGAVTLRLLP
jgi:DUF4097 and DUF4098 domain-containing protein YvlB